MRTTYVIGIDPGDSTGVVVLRDGRLYDFFQGDPQRAIRLLRTTLERARAEGADALLGCERFVSSGRPGRTHQATPQQLIGQVIVTADALNFQVLLQAPVDVKKFASNDLLRRLGLHFTPRDVRQPDANDVNDASRHAVYLLGTRFTTTFTRLLDALERDDVDVP